jgi:hypothetical protein
MAIARNGKQSAGLIPRQKDGAVPDLRGLGTTRTQSGGVDVTELLRMEIVFRHVGEAVKHAEAADAMDGVTRFFQHFARQCDLRALAGVYAAAGKLKLRPGFFLKRGQYPVACVNDRIGTRTRRIALPGKRRSAKSAIHGFPRFDERRSCHRFHLSPRSIPSAMARP